LKTMKPSGLRKHLTDYYPGIKEYVNKIKTAEEKEDRVKATIAAYTIQAELTHMICQGETGTSHSGFNTPSETNQEYIKHKIPDLLVEPSKLSEQAEKLDQATKNLLIKQEINLNIIKNLTEFTKIMKEKH
ncbi:MAG: hypothetical protein NWF07_03105, partial [Candidatus Bathyarchaeota archaeon]|nr:hypothetical protein [Candidatus Bathyarchaeota archaeon]